MKTSANAPGDAPPLFSSPAAANGFALGLPTQALGKRITYHFRTHSTNDLALKAARQGAPHGELFIADVQDGGRGRRGQRWQSPPGAGLLFSLIVRPQGDPLAEVGWVSLLSGLAVSEALREACGVSATLKWPNDIVLPCEGVPGWKKLGGILCESSLAETARATAEFIVIGVGLNINHRRTELPDTAKAPPTSAHLETGRTFDRQQILAAVLGRLELRWLAVDRTGVHRQIEQQLRQWWSSKTLLCSQCALANGTARAQLEGQFAGLDSHGHLRLKDAHAGELVIADAEIVGLR